MQDLRNYNELKNGLVHTQSLVCSCCCSLALYLDFVNFLCISILTYCALVQCYGRQCYAPSNHEW